ncbi:MAG TPA: hypothetical protein VGQ38_09310, partial [Gaiellaceae bacterium]|nr:hypothetical protein [Gaiellaceae bacterium]
MRQLAAAAAVVFLLLTAVGAAAEPPHVQFVISWGGSGSADALSLETMTLQQVLPNNATNLSFSADGTHMTYDQSGLVVVADGNGSNPRIVNTMGLHPSTGPSLSPDATHVVFTSDGGHLYVATVDSQDGEVHQITGSTHIDERPAWSPRGDAIAFTRLSDVGRPELWVVGPTGGDRQLTFGGVNTYSNAPAWSPDGKSIAFNEETYLGNHVSIMNADGSDAHAITPEFSRPFGYAAPAWSPDATRIAFAESPTRLDVIGVDRQNWTQLHDGGPNDILRIAWRPHGAGLTAAFDDLDSPVARHTVTVTGEVRSLGDQPATSVVVSVTASSARIVSMSVGATTCSGTCAVPSIPGDTTLPLKVTLAPLRT